MAKLTKSQKRKREKCVKSRKKEAGRKKPTSSDFAICTSVAKKKGK